MNKPKLLVLIPNFGTHQSEYLDIVLSEYEKFEKIKVDIVLFSTNGYENKFNINLTQKRIDTKGSHFRMVFNLYMNFTM